MIPFTLPDGQTVALLLGASVLLGLGAIASTCTRAPRHRQRMTESVLIASLLWFACAWLPLPRQDWSHWLPDGDQGGGVSDAAIGARGRNWPTHSFEIETGGATNARMAAEFRENHTALQALEESSAWTSTADSGALPVNRSDVRPAIANTTDLPTFEEGAPLHEEEAPWQRGEHGASLQDEVGESSSIGHPSPGQVAVLDRDLRQASVLPSKRPLPEASTRPDRWQLGLQFYVLGSLAAAAYLLLGVLRLRRVLRTATPVASWVRTMVDSDWAHLSETIPIVASPTITTPFCFGFWRPKIVLPSALLKDRAGLQEVLRHEFAHVHQGDGWGKLLFSIALPVFWIHPLYWVLKRQHHLATEIVADELASSFSDRHRYARQLIALADHGPSRKRTLAGANPVFASPSVFYRRIEMLLNRTQPLNPNCSLPRRLTQLGLTLGVASVCIAFLGRQATAAQDVPAQETPAETTATATEDPVSGSDQRSTNRANQVGSVWDTRNVGEWTAEDYRATHKYKTARDPFDSQAPRTKNVRVKAGDSLAKIMRAHGLELSQLDQVLALNPKLSAHHLAVGQIVKLPVASNSNRTEALEALGYVGAVDGRGPFGSDQAGEAGVADAGTSTESLTEAYDILAGAMDAGTRSHLAELGYVGANANSDAPAMETPSAFSRPHAVRESVQVTLTDSTLDLALRAIELQGELEINQADFAQTEALAAKNMVPKRDMLKARVKLDTLQRQFKLMHSLVEAEIEASMVELEYLMQRKDSGSSGQFDAQILRLRSRINILKSVF